MMSFIPQRKRMLYMKASITVTTEMCIVITSSFNWVSHGSSMRPAAATRAATPVKTSATACSSTTKDHIKYPNAIRKEKSCNYLWPIWVLRRILGISTFAENKKLRKWKDIQETGSTLVMKSNRESKTSKLFLEVRGLVA